jgi:hypothetical protein
MEKQVREAELEAQQLQDLEDGMGRAIQQAHDAWHEALDILNDCKGRYKTEKWHKEAQKREWVFMQEVVDCFGTNSLSDDQRKRWEARELRLERLDAIEQEANLVSGDKLGDTMVLLNLFMDAASVAGSEGEGR